MRFRHPRQVGLFLLLMFAPHLYAQMGPSVLSRGGGSIRNRGSGRIANIRPYAGVYGVYTDGLRPLDSSFQDGIPDLTGYGYSAMFGANGYHTWKDSSLDLTYFGRFGKYSRSDDSGLDQILRVGYTKEVTPRVTITASQLGGTYSRGIGLPLGTQLGLGSAIFSPGNAVYTPGIDLFDTRTWFTATGGQASYQKSSRLSFGMMGAGFRTWREGTGISDVIGYTAVSDVAYRVSRRQTVGVEYGFAHHHFTQQFGNAYVHSVAGQYAATLGRRWNFSSRLGVYRLESERLGRAQLDPAIAAILGQTTATEAFHGVNYGLIAGATLSRPFRRSGQFTMSYNRTVLPGNGIYLTSQSDIAGLGYSYAGLRNWSLGAAASYTRLSTRLRQNLGSLESYFANVNVGRRIISSLHFGSSAGLRRIHYLNAQRQDTYQISIGFTFTPGEFPLSFY